MEVRTKEYVWRQNKDYKGGKLVDPLADYSGDLNKELV